MIHEVKRIFEKSSIIANNNEEKKPYSICALISESRPDTSLGKTQWFILNQNGVCNKYWQWQTRILSSLVYDQF